MFRSINYFASIFQWDDISVYFFQHPQSNRQQED
jgi:hypothetical protein